MLALLDLDSSQQSTYKTIDIAHVGFSTALNHGKQRFGSHGPLLITYGLRSVTVLVISSSLTQSLWLSGFSKKSDMASPRVMKVFSQRRSHVQMTRRLSNSVQKHTIGRTIEL